MDFATMSSLGEILQLFLRLGMTAYGGPAAHIGLMQREAVERRKWMSQQYVTNQLKINIK